MLKVAIIGCGKIADSHASQIQRIEGAEIVGVCDREPLMARQLYERFPVKQHYSDVREMLAVARPDVVHITTPPASHFDLARSCLQHGSHVYVEKPFTLCLKDAEALVALADAKGLRLTAGHDDQFSHVARRMRGLVQSGYLGGGPLHMYVVRRGSRRVRDDLGDFLACFARKSLHARAAVRGASCRQIATSR